MIHQDKTMGMRRRNTKRKESDLQKQGFNVVSMWEHKWTNMKKKDKEVKEFVNSDRPDLREPSLPMRDGFFGGRTEVFDLYVKAQKDVSEIGYADVTSLYPYVNAMKEYPVGHPTRTRDEKKFIPLNELLDYKYCKLKPIQV